MTVTTYDFKNTSVLINGVLISGYADGDAIQMEQREDSVELLVGAGGDSEYSESNDKSATLTLTLLVSSASSIYLEDLHNAGEELDVQIIDKNQNSRNKAASQCRIQRNAPLTRGKEGSPREWTILMPEITII